LVKPQQAEAHIIIEMTEEPLERLLVRRFASRGVVNSLFTAMEFTRAIMEQDPQKHQRLGILMDQLAKRIELLKVLDEKILQAVDLNGMEPEILSAEQFLADTYIRRALFQADYDSLKPPPTLLSPASAGVRHLKRSSKPPPKPHPSLLYDSPQSSPLLPDDATEAVIGASKVSTLEPSTLVTSIINPVPDSTQGCVDDSSSSPSKTVATIFSSDSIQAEEPTSDEGIHISFIADLSSKPIDLPIVEHDQVHLFAAGAATVSHQQEIPVTILDEDQTTGPDLAIHNIINSTTHHQTEEAAAAAAPIKKLPLPVGIYSNHHVYPARAH